MKKYAIVVIAVISLFLPNCAHTTQPDLSRDAALSLQTPGSVALPLVTAGPCTFHHFEDWHKLDSSQVKQMTDEAMIEKIAAIASERDKAHLGKYFREVRFIENPDNPEILFVEYDRLYRSGTCQDTTLLRRANGVWQLLPTPAPGMSSYDAADLIAFVWECDGWSLYIAAGEGYYLSASREPYRSRTGGLHWSGKGDLPPLDK
ncbi:MAG: hypothetical protein JW918_10420 [Anaerolineae bacterium]|nr:hypothetical protein [Anaerolineae bacterium]